MHADRDFPQDGEAAPARINRGGALRTDRKPNLGRVLKINLYGKLSLGLHGVSRIELRNNVAGEVLPFPVGPPDTVHFGCKHLPWVEVERNFNRLPYLYILEGLLIEAG